VGGFSLHANVAIPARDRRRLERLCRYVGRPPVASERDRIVPVASRSPTAEATVAMSHDRGPTHRSPADLGRKPFHEPVAATAFESSARTALGAASIAYVNESRPIPENPALRVRRLTWAELLRRAFAIDVLACPRCGGRLRLLAAIQSPEARHAVLDCLGLPPRAPPLAAAAPENSGDTDFEYQADPTGTPDIDPGFDFGA
jgi:hypothetical protein